MRTLLIVDDDALVRHGVRVLLELWSYDIYEAGDKQTALGLASEHAFDAALVDISIPRTPSDTAWARTTLGLELVRELKALNPLTGIVVLSAYEHFLEEILQLLREGQRGIAYRLKGRRADLLPATLERVMDGHIDIDREAQGQQTTLDDLLLSWLTPEERPWVEVALQGFDGLTQQEARAASLLAASRNLEGVAERLGIQRADVLVGRIYGKLGLDELARSGAPLRQIAILIKASQIRDVRASAGRSR